VASHPLNLILSMTPDPPDPVPQGLSVPPALSDRWLARKARDDAELQAEAQEIAQKQREHEERIAREKRVIELLEKILEKLSGK
jgi:hypothetical protein